MKFDRTKIKNWGILLSAMAVSIYFDLKWLWFLLLIIFVYLVIMKIEKWVGGKVTNHQRYDRFETHKDVILSSIKKNEELRASGLRSNLNSEDNLVLIKKKKKKKLANLNTSTALNEKDHSYEEIPENNFNYDDYHDGHTEEIWKDIDFKVRSECLSYSKKYYSFKEVEPKSKNILKYASLTKNQRKVKILGDAILARTKSKKISKKILVKQYGFKEEVAKYAVGYDGYYDW